VLSSAAMLSVIIPTLNAAATLPASLAALAEGTPGEIVVADGGSADGTPAVARAGGCRVVEGARGRGAQLKAGAAAARGKWLLFLHADTCLEAGWAAAVHAFCAAPANAQRAAYFRFALADAAPAARRLEAFVAWRCAALGLPYGDQGLLISAAAYRALGGFSAVPLMEDVELVRRIGAANLTALPVRAVTSAARYRRGGYWRRPLRNLLCLGLYFAGVAPRHLARLYG
jgi:rSAM/selenodomain-associated transferase 2